MPIESALDELAYANNLKLNKSSDGFYIPEPSQKEVVWPLIAYKGMIKNGQQPLGIVEIDTKKSLVSDGIRLKELTIKKVYSDSIVIVLDKDTKTFYKK